MIGDTIVVGVELEGGPVSDARKPGRPAEFDRTAAIQSAMNLFWERGYEAVSASDLANAMSIERSSFYNSFGDRDRVFREAMAVYAKGQPDVALAQVKVGQPVKPVLRRVFRELCQRRAADRRGCLIVNSIGELVGTHPALGPEIVSALKRREKMLERLVAQAVTQREIPDSTDPRAVAHVLLTLLCGLNVISKVIRDEKTLWRISKDTLGRFGF